MTFEELKKWVYENYDSFPGRFEIDYIRYLNPQFTATFYIDVIHKRIEICKEKGTPIQKDTVAIAYKNNLQRLVNDIQSPDKWIIKKVETTHNDI